MYKFFRPLSFQPSSFAHCVEKTVAISISETKLPSYSQSTKCDKTKGK